MCWHALGAAGFTRLIATLAMPGGRDLQRSTADTGPAPFAGENEKATRLLDADGCRSRVLTTEGIYCDLTVASQAP